MTKEEIEQLKKFSKSGVAKTLIKYIQEKMELLNKISNIGEDGEVEVEVRGRKRAIEILNTILQDIKFLQNEEKFERKKSEYE